MRISIIITEERIKRAEALARQRRMKTGDSASRSSEIGRAIDFLFSVECPTDTTLGLQIVKDEEQPAEVAA